MGGVQVSYDTSENQTGKWQAWVQIYQEVINWKWTEKLNQSEIIRMGKIKTNMSVHVDNKILHIQT